MTISYPSLNVELTTDPKGLGYANTLPTSDIATAALLNNLTGPGVGTVTIPSFTRGQLLDLSIPLEDQLNTGTSVSGVTFTQLLINKWTGRFDALRSGDPVIQTSAIINLLNSAVTDGLTTSAYVTQITTRTGSRAEVLFGVGTVAVWQDVAKAMGRM